MSTRLALKDLEPGANFIARHIGPDAAETAAMLKTVGAKSVEDFIDKVVPKRIRAKRPGSARPVQSFSGLAALVRVAPCSGTMRPALARK